MTDITELAQSHELLIANGQQTADLLRHLADNEIDSDYFAVVSECESYGKETDAELSITEFALRAAGYVDALVEALEKAKGMETYWKTQCRGITDHCEQLQAHIAELEESHAQVIQSRDHYKRMSEEGLKKLAESRTVKLPAACADDEYFIDGVFQPMRYERDVERALRAAGIKWEAE
ncbi:CDK5 domain-containing protein [Klebsiella variicola]|uniref:CDK5 domain-containing protein n=1 Tax=Klebsiella variicola TaxID=244366 RepID=UPI0022572D69|nr:CDK5 domain-containing protein [Klebsiella variicola]